MSTQHVSASFLALSADARHAWAALIEPVGGSHRLIAWEQGEAATRQTPGQGPGVTDRMRNVAQNLGARLGRPLWDESQGGPLLHSPEPTLGLHLGQVVAAVDPLPPLRVWLGGLTSYGSLAAAQASLESTSSVVAATYRFGGGARPAELAADLAYLSPDLLVVAGGYDRPGSDASAPVRALCAEVGQALAELPPERRPALLFAGNQYAARECLARITHVSGGGAADAVANVAPGPGVRRLTPLAVAVSRLYWRRCRATPAIREISRWITPPGEVRSLAWSFAQAVRLWRQIHDLPFLHGLFCASAPWLHVWAAEGWDGVRLRYTHPRTRPPDVEGWPPVQLVSGPWPDAIWPRPRVHWWDAGGLLPTVANVGQIDPSIAYQVLAQDLLRGG